MLWEQDNNKVSREKKYIFLLVHSLCQHRWAWMTAKVHSLQLQNVAYKKTHSVVDISSSSLVSFSSLFFFSSLSSSSSSSSLSPLFCGPCGLALRAIKISPAKSFRNLPYPADGRRSWRSSTIATIVKLLAVAIAELFLRRKSWQKTLAHKNKSSPTLLHMTTTKEER